MKTQKYTFPILILITTILCFVFFQYRVEVLSTSNINKVYQYRKSVGIGFDYPIQSKLGILIINKTITYKYIIIDGYENRKYSTISTENAVKELIRLIARYKVNSIPLYTLCSINNEDQINKLINLISLKISGFNFERKNSNYIICTCGSDGMHRFNDETIIDFLAIKYMY